MGGASNKGEASNRQNTVAKVKVDPHAKNQGHRSNGSAVRALTDRQMDATKCIIYLASAFAFGVDD